MTANTYDVKDKVVIVTGAGTGIGAAITDAFLDNGATVVVAGRRKEKLDEVIAGRDNALAVQTDVSKHDDVAALVKTAVDTYGHLDVVINNAGQHVGGDVTETSDEDFAAAYGTNVDGFFYMLKEALPELAKTNGSITVVTSVSGIGGDWGQPVYNSTKYALSGLIQSAALDWGAKGVRINGIAPAFTKTPMTADMADSDDDLQPFVDRLALGRVGVPEDLAGISLFLSTKDAQYITGQIIPVDGGTTASNGQPRR